MSELDPDIIPEAWDNALLGTTITPGLITLSQGGRVLKWDAKPGLGQSGATTKLTGIEAGEFEMTIEFWDGVLGTSAAEQRTHWETQCLPLLKEAESGKFAIEFYHPAVSEPPMNVRSVVPKKIGMYEQDKQTGVWKVTCSMLAYGKPKPASGTPKASKAALPAPLDPNEKKIAQLTQQLKELNDS